MTPRRCCVTTRQEKAVTGNGTPISRAETRLSATVRAGRRDRQLARPSSSWDFGRLRSDLDAEASISSMSEPTRGLLDISVVIDHDVIEVSLLPDESATSSTRMHAMFASCIRETQDPVALRASVHLATVRGVSHPWTKPSIRVTSPNYRMERMGRAGRTVIVADGLPRNAG